MKIWGITSDNMQYSVNALYYFKKEFNVNGQAYGKIKITADARYKLWINGEAASFGPYKGLGNEKYYSAVEIGKFLKTGKNEIFVEVLQLASEKDISSHRYLSSVPRTGNMALLISGEFTDSDGIHEIGTDGSWMCAKEENISFIVPDYASYAGLGECIGSGYKKCLAWEKAKEWIWSGELTFYGETKLWNIKDSEFLPQKYIAHTLTKKDEAGNFDFGKIVTGFVRMKLGGKGKLKITYAESYTFIENGKEIKKNRTDTSGEIRGDYDIIYVDGELNHETFWFRTFRYIKTETEGEVYINEMKVMETGYPISVDTGYDFGGKKDNKLWEISVDTLKCCMHETYEDCPYYEQLQYAMDTYLQIMFSLRLSDDAALAKRAVHAFAASLQAGDMCQSRFPSITPQYIVGFSLYIIFMLDAIEKNCGDLTFIKKYLGTVDTVFSGFDELKRSDGLIGKNKYWNFIDWANGWEEGHGVPESDCGEAFTVYNLMYAEALYTAARLNRIFGRNDTAKEYEKIAESIKKTVKEKCFCVEKGLYADTDRKKSFSQHAQVWAVLCGLETAEEGKRLMKESLSLSAKGGFAYAYYVFRAFEKVGEYELSKELMDKYYGLIDMECTTIPETPENPRSECHAWGAVAIYEFTYMVLGVKEDDACILINPYIEGRTSAKGSVYTKHGKVYVCWEKTGEKFKITAESESMAEINIIMPGGKMISGKSKVEGEITIC